MPQVDGQLPREREMAERRVEAPGGPVLDAPGQREPAVGHPPAGNREVDLVVGQTQQHPSVRPQVSEEVDLVVPGPLRAEVRRRRVAAVDHVDGEVLGPRVPVEARAEDLAVAGPGVAGVGGGMDAEDPQVAGAPCRLRHLLLLLGPRRLADGEEGQDAGRLEEVGREVADIADRDGREAGQVGELRQRRDRLGQGPVHACRSVHVRGDLGDDQHVPGHAASVRLVRGRCPVVECTGSRTQES